MGKYSFEGTNRTKHEKMRVSPSHKKLVLRNALQNAGFKNIQYEAEFRGEFPDGYRPVWYDASVDVIYQGQVTTAVIFLVDDHAMQPTSEKHKPINFRTRQRKLACARAYGMPFLEIWPSTTDMMWMELEKWRMFIDETPQVEAGKKPAYLRPVRKKDKISRAPKGQRMR